MYCVIMTDPDAPSRKEPNHREWIHWVKINVKGSDLNGSGEDLIAYVGSGPPKGTGLHRYVQLVYEQASWIDIKKCGQQILGNAGCGGKGRGQWSASKFTKHNGLKKLVSGNYYQAKQLSSKFK